MAGLYSHLSDKKLFSKIKKYQNKIDKKDDMSKQKLYINVVNALNKEKSKRLKNATMTIKNLIN